MKLHLYIITSLFVLLIAGSARAQITISGKVIDRKEKPIIGATVYLDNTIDGATTDSFGQFSFTTSELGHQTIVANEITHETMGLPIQLMHDTAGIVLIMGNSKIRDLDEVTITAGSFDATNDKAKTILKPLDIVTTAGANADVVKAIQTLPGTQQNGTENGLFVRGGDAAEAAIIVDEMVVQNAFFSGGPGVATRSRFGAFSYQGVSFSSGGYSARYGQALSGVLELTTTDLPDKSNLNLGANTAGLYASGTKKWKNSALEGGANYNNLTPFYKIATTNFNFYKPPVGGGGNVRYVWKPNKSGILKASGNVSFNTNGVGIPNPYSNMTDTTNSSSGGFAKLGDTIKFVTDNAYYYGTISYKQMFKTKFSLYTAASYSMDVNLNSFADITLNQWEHRAQYRLEGKYFFTGRMNLLLGGDWQNYGIEKNTRDTFKQQFEENIYAGYAEMEWTPLYWLALKPGIRYEHSVLLNTDKVAPRLAAAIKTGRHSQASLATGQFFQNANNNYLIAGHKPGMQQAIHAIANWQWSAQDRTFRLEGYYKDYASLIREPFNPYVQNRYRSISDTLTLNNTGTGYATGIEFFWRDKKSIKNADYWVSYSYIDTRRLYENFPFKATPTFIATHNLNVIGKYFVEKWHTMISGTYTLTSGYPYYNPEVPATEATFLADRTPMYHNTALSAAYLHSFGKWFSVFYISIDNVLNTHNVFGYRYSYDKAGNVIPGSRSNVVPALYRTIFFGANFSLTQFKKDEL